MVLFSEQYYFTKVGSGVRPFLFPVFHRIIPDMSRSIIIIVLSLLTALFPHLGFPGNIKNTAVTLLSLGIAVLGYMAYRSARAENARKQYEEYSMADESTDTLPE